MNSVITILTPLIVALGAFAVFGFARKENKRKNEKLNRRNFVARSTHTWGVIMIVIEVLLAFLLVFGNIEEPFGVGVNVILGVLVLAFGFGILQNLRERVVVLEDKFTVIPMIGKKREYEFSKIEKIESKKTGHYVFVNGKKVLTLDPTGIGTSLFVEIYKTR